MAVEPDLAHSYVLTSWTFVSTIGTSDWSRDMSRDFWRKIAIIWGIGGGFSNIILQQRVLDAG